MNMMFSVEYARTQGIDSNVLEPLPLNMPSQNDLFAKKDSEQVYETNCNYYSNCINNIHYNTADNSKYSGFESSHIALERALSLVSPAQEEQQFSSDDGSRSDFPSIPIFTSWSPDDLEPIALLPNDITGKSNSETFSFEDSADCTTCPAVSIQNLGTVASELQVFSLSPEPKPPVLVAKGLSEEALDMLLQQQIMYIQKHKNTESIPAVQNNTENQSEKVMETFLNVDATLHQRQKLASEAMTEKDFDFLLQHKISSINRNIARPRDSCQQQQVVDLTQDNAEQPTFYKDFGDDCSDDDDDDKSLSHYHALARALLLKERELKRVSNVSDRISKWDDLAQERSQNPQAYGNRVSFAGKQGCFLESSIPTVFNYNAHFPSSGGECRKQKFGAPGLRLNECSQAESSMPPLKKMRSI